MKNKNRYLKIVEWSDEDQCYVGSIPGWIGKCCHGNDEKKVYHELCEILDEWIEVYKKDGIPLPLKITAKKYSGKFQLRIDSELHKALAIRAMQADESLNSYCSRLLKNIVLKPDILKSKKLSEESFNKVWNNSSDEKYDSL